MEANLRELSQRLKANNLKVTAQRLGILKEVFHGNYHLTAEEIFLKVKKNHANVSLSTVYRTLDTLVALKELKIVNAQGFMNYYDRRLEQHHHIICDQCGAISDLDISMDCVKTCATREAKENFHIKGFSVVFYAECKNCKND